MNIEDLPALNAGLNGVASLFLLGGWLMIKQRGNRRLHTVLMICALVSSALFLSSYLVYHYHVGHTVYEGEGLIRLLYFSILLTHVPLATLMVPFIFAAVWFAYRQRFDLHVRITRYVWPVWMYVSVTGVMIYVMLYQL